MPIALLLLLYVILLVTPVPLPFVRDQAEALVLASMPPSSRLELGDMALAIEGGTWPVLRFSPVTFTDTKTGANIGMEALEVGFSPVRALVGQPGATVTMVGPHIQVNQDIFGPRLATLEVVPGADGAPDTVRVIEGEDAFPHVGLLAEGLDVRGELPEGTTAGMRSDNDWLIYNLEASAASMADIVEQAEMGRFSRLIIRDGKLDVNDALFGLFRTFDDITLDVTPSPDGKTVAGQFAARFGGTTMSGSIERTVLEDGSSRLKSGITNMDFASLMPFVNDPAAIMAIIGAGAVSIDVGFEAGTGKVTDGIFHVDLTGTELRIEQDLFPIASGIMEVRWAPQTGQFTLAETPISVGNTTADVSGVYVLGLDDLYGPTIGMTTTMRNVAIHPNDLPAPEVPFTEMRMSGWSAPLYGAMGIDQFVAEKPGAKLATTGRIDMLRDGMGLEMTIAGEGITADDLKRLWPYFLSRETRDWFVGNVTEGVISRATMRYDFPVGTLAMTGEEKPVPEGGIYIDMAATGVAIKPSESMEPIAIDGQTRLIMRDDEVTIAGDSARLPTEGGDINFANAALVMSSDAPGTQTIEISGDVAGSIPSIIALAKQQQPDAIDEATLPVDLAALGGNVNLALVATLLLDDAGQMTDMDYVLNGTIRDFGSSAPIESHTISDGQLSFVASQEGYHLSGTAEVDGLAADVVVQGEPTGNPNLLISSTLDVADLADMGFDVSEFLSGEVKFVARPMPDASLQMAVDITGASLTIKDLGISKAAGVSGVLEAAIKQTGTLTELTQVKLKFGDVNLEGQVAFDSESGLQSADFSTFALSPGDKAQIALAPIDGGFRVRLRGEQLDLKPMLNRFFGLGEGSTGGPQASGVDQTIVIDAELTRALGFFRTTAFNVNLELALRGTDLQRVSLQAQLGGDRSVSVTTNPGPEGKILSVAFNDFGTLLRLMGVYPNIEGGVGTLVMSTVREQNADFGQFVLRDFAIVDEDKVADILGNHDGSRELIASRNKLEFKSGQVDFIRRKDRIEVSDAILTGAEVGGTMRGFIYTEARTYDLAGTYVPLFGLSSAFQRLPLFGPLLGGREGEGLFGVTFAVRGPLDSPDFKINPVSALVPGAFRRLFEYRARELPRVE